MTVNPAHIRDLYAHMEWADALIWRAVPEAGNAAPDHRLRDCLYHIHFVQRAFLQVWTQQTVPPYESARVPTLGDVRAEAQAYYRDVAAFLTTLDRADLNHRLDVPWARMFDQQMDGQPANTTLGDTLLQVPYHSHYHRGQVNTRLRELGAEPPLVDYIAWVWQRRPQPDWPT